MSELTPPASAPDHKARVALVIGSGSIKCTAAIGMQKVLARENIGIDMVVGCSGGSLYATLIALGYDAATSERMTYDLWTREITSKRNRKAMFQLLFPGLFNFDGRFGLIDDRLIMRRLRKAYDKKTFADAKIPLYILTADFLTGEQIVLTEGLLVDAIRASIAIPFVFEPWEIDGRLMIDGAVVDPMPVDVAIRENVDVIISLGFESPYQRKLNSVVRYAFQVTTVMTNNLFRANYAFHTLSHHTEVLSVIPEFDERIGAFDTSKVPAIIEAGARAMEQQLPYLRRLLGLE